MGLAWTIKVSQDLPTQPESGESRWIAASLNGEQDAFSELVRLHQHRVFKLVGRFFQRREDVEDLAQETFLTAWRKLGTFKARAPFEHWLTRICLNCCYARLRTLKTTVALENTPEPAAAPSDPTARIEIERLLQDLDPRDRFILLLMYGEGWSAAEIAEKVGWSTVNVKVRSHRARKRLRRMLEQESDS